MVISIGTKAGNVWLYGAIALWVHLLSSSTSADIYKYVDSDGVVHYTNVPTSSKFVWVMHETGKTKPPRSLVTSFDDIIKEASFLYDVEESLVKAIIKVESDFDPYAVSEDGARGLMQLMPETARLMGVRDVHDSYENILGGVKYLKYLLKKFNGNIQLALAAYNAGERRVKKYMAIPPFDETKRFVERVLHYYRKYKNQALLKRSSR